MRLWIGVAVLVAMAGSWGGVRAQVADDPEVPLSYLLKQQQIAFAREFVWFARDLISGGVGTHIASAHWEKDNMVLTVGGPLRGRPGAPDVPPSRLGPAAHR